MTGEPFFSICIPQFNRTAYLLRALDSFGAQSFRDFEICISDDCSTDGRTCEIEARLRELRVPYKFHKRTENGRYDANLRTAIGLASGRFCLLMGNDDCLAHNFVLERLHETMSHHDNLGVVLMNYADFSTGKVIKRVFKNEIVRGGPRLASSTFRNFSFVSGVILGREPAQAFATNSVDGSEMYQMHIGSRMLAGGYDLLRYEQPDILKDIEIPGENAAIGPVRQERKGIYVHVIPILAQFGRTAYTAIAPYTRQKGSASFLVFSQVYLFTYPFNILNYRRNRSWIYAFRAALGVQPRIVLRGLGVPLWQRVVMLVLYIAAMAGALIMPLAIFAALMDTQHQFAKRTTSLSMRITA
jgi:glycosyltransferase involved in cell wall biosynthesis